MAEVTPLSLPKVCTSLEAKPRDHKDGGHLLVLEGDKIAYVAVPPCESATATENTRLCFTDHHNGALNQGSDNCCLWGREHVHAHVHHGEITEDVLLEQCLEEACCVLPLRWDFTGLSASDLSHHNEHIHKEGCGHNKIAHGDHIDWLLPMKDGSFLLSHPQMSNEGVSEFTEHGRLVKVGESLKLQRNSKLVDLFCYGSPKAKGYASLAQGDEGAETNFSKLPRDGYRGFLSSSGLSIKPPMKDEMVKIAIPEKYRRQGLEKTVLDVMGLCCPADIPLIKKILEPLTGVEDVSVNLTSKTVTVLHDRCLTADVQLVKALNEARMEASIHLRGQVKTAHKWPSHWTIACGFLLVVAFFQYLYHPLRWVALGAVAIGIPPIVLRTFVSIRRLVLHINLLMLIAVGGAVALGDYLEAGSIVFLFTIADWLESRSSNKARAAMSSLMSLVPRSAVLAENGQRIPVEDVKLKTLIAVKAGEMVPIDGIVTLGKCSVDESSLTGESRPVEKDVGSHVWAGTVNLSGFISVETTALSEDSAVSRMVKLVEEAQGKHSHTEQVVERFAKYYTPVLVAASAAIAVTPLAAHVHNERHWLYLAVVLLVVACPCALVISTPVTTSCGITQAAREGLIIKGGNFLEVLGKLKIIAVDKTGTLTEGHFAVSQMLPVDSTTDIRQLLYWIASVESKSSHPMAPALVAYAQLHGVEISQEITDFEILSGEGVSALVDRHLIQIGNERLASRLGWHEDIDAVTLEKCNVEGSTIGWAGVDGKCLGVYSMADQHRPEAYEAMESLKKLGIKVVMLTGDNHSSALAVSNKVGSIEFHAQLLPEDKVRTLQELKSTGITSMIGDGINDAPALAAADVGIAMGVAGSAVAMETAHVALMTNDLRKLAAAVILGRKCRSKIQQNVCLSILTKAIIIALAATGYASLWAAVLGDVGTCIVVIFNSMLVLKKAQNGLCQKKSGTIGSVIGWFTCGDTSGTPYHENDCCGTKCTDNCEAPKRCCEDSLGLKELLTL
ncbi:hypothetical protein O6H91_06G121500 [Diphasiastrum complanatum]|uniref:Uncharacterized protein n=1 Tax=Diphasiastrum complanatum TaxID=34168 RepID=A0ACC2DIH8_DIPCM|nr:hypothetical protein O6H91_06G121500 [Diphasiastrum complanatum]